MTGAMQDYLMTSESLNEQEETIKASICPLSMDPARCDAMVESYWKDLGKPSATNYKQMKHSAKPLMTSLFTQNDSWFKIKQYINIFDREKK